MTGDLCPELPDEFRQIVFSLEKYSSHPIARSITREWKGKNSGRTLRWAKVEEVKGLGMRGETHEGDIYWAGSYKVAAALTADATHNVYIVCNDQLLGWIDVRDTVRPESAVRRPLAAAKRHSHRIVERRPPGNLSGSCARAGYHAKCWRSRRRSKNSNRSLFSTGGCLPRWSGTGSMMRPRLPARRSGFR